ncbi:hypothetical protein LCGC14_0747800 [marine sediment metagenome]|uniref:Uncharacterized protein n=1 Tax=marine sediment metagenome TaxID=412755 RepID=A0A0F9TBW7_9ZZZZ
MSIGSRNLLSHELKQVHDTLDGVKERNSLTQAATLERELSWAHRVFVEMGIEDRHHVKTFMILRHDFTWASVVRAER